LILIVLPGAALADGTWSAPENLSASSISLTGASVAVDGAGRVHVVWAEGGLIQHRVRTDGAWSDAAVVSDGDSPVLASRAQGGVQMAFARTATEGDDVYYTVWEPTGWQPAVNLSESSATSLQPALATRSDGHVAVVWSETNAGDTAIYLAESSDGSTWASGPVPDGQGTNPTVALGSGDAVYVAWEDPLDVGMALDIWVTERLGGAWGLPRAISFSTADATSAAPAMVATGGRVYLAWMEETGQENAIYMSVRDAEGWTAGQRHSTAAQAWDPTMAPTSAGGGELAWAAGNLVQTLSWDAAGVVAATIETVASGQTSLEGVALAVGSDAVHVTWLAESASGNLDVYYAEGGTPPPAQSMLCLPLVVR
jgi:hypothetical protein